MSQYNSLPFLVINFGTEILYVLHSRLESQNVSKTKVERVMVDLTTAMLNKTFLDELFRPQELYTEGATRSLFGSICDSSIIHLDTNSMQKLYDLVTVGVKYQLIALTHPKELVDWTLNHLDGLVSLVPACGNLIAAALPRFEALVATMSGGDLATIRFELLNFCSTCRIRGSLLLEKGFQNADGTFCIPTLTRLPPGNEGYEAPGVIRIYKASSPYQVSFQHPHATLSQDSKAAGSAWNPFGGVRATATGSNMYQSSRASTAAKKPPAASSGAATKTAVVGGAAPDPVPAQKLNAYQGEVAYLCKLVGAQNTAPKIERIQLDFFADDVDVAPSSVATTTTTPQAGGATTTSSAPSTASTVQRMDAASIQKENKKLINIIDGLGDKKSAGQNTGNNDLLDIMDEL